MEWIAVFVGGGLGSLARYGIARLLSDRNLEFAWATLTANLISCIILGLLMGVISKNITPAVKIFWMVGFCGGFSTFSTFTGETFQFFNNGQYHYAILNILGSIIVCMIGLVVGYRIVQ